MFQRLSEIRMRLFMPILANMQTMQTAAANFKRGVSMRLSKTGKENKEKK